MSAQHAGSSLVGRGSLKSDASQESAQQEICARECQADVQLNGISLVSTRWP